jgi:hypothetical protein
VCVCNCAMRPALVCNSVTALRNDVASLSLREEKKTFTVYTMQFTWDIIHDDLAKVQIAENRLLFKVLFFVLSENEYAKKKP